MYPAIPLVLLATPFLFRAKGVASETTILKLGDAIASKWRDITEEQGCNLWVHPTNLSYTLHRLLKPKISWLTAETFDACAVQIAAIITACDISCDDFQPPLAHDVVRPPPLPVPRVSDFYHVTTVISDQPPLRGRCEDCTMCITS